MGALMPNFFKQKHQPRGFNLPHRRYDERKEALEKLKKKHDNSPDGENYDKDTYREHLHSEWRKSRTSGSNGPMTLRILLIFAVLMVLAYLYLLS